MISEASPSITNTYVWGLDLSGTLQGAGGVGGLIFARLNVANVFYGMDGNGNVSDLVASSGTVAAHYEYDPFGNQIVGTGSSADLNPWRFSTKYWEPETGLLHYELRPYFPSIGKWAQRDLIGEDGGENLYAFVENNPVSCVDPLGLWKRVASGGHVWIAESGDTLSDLAAKSEYGGRGKNWSCLWPVGNTQDHGYPNQIKPCDRYDASNLAAPAPNATSLSVSLAPDLKAGHESVYGVMTAIRADQLANKIKAVSGEGGTPISNMIVGGHGGYSGEVTGTWYYFKVQQIVDLNQSPTFARAKQKKGPVRCWFTQDATARFAGCSSGSGIADSFARRILRKNATAIGTNQTVGHGSGKIYYNWNSATSTWGANTASWQIAPVWRTYNATW